jgi:hypothetical protein
MVRSGAPVGLNKATVNAWRGALEARGLGSVPINVRITAVQKLAVEAADNGPPEQMFFYGQTDSGYGSGRQLSMDGTSRVTRESCTDL